MIYFERLKVWVILDKVSHIQEANSTTMSPLYKDDYKTTTYYKLVLIGGTTFNLTLEEKDLLIKALS